MFSCQSHCMCKGIKKCKHEIGNGKNNLFIRSFRSKGDSLFYWVSASVLKNPYAS